MELKEAQVWEYGTKSSAEIVLRSQLIWLPSANLCRGLSSSEVGLL
jgi:hypothetical protein